MEKFDCRECPEYEHCDTLCDRAEEYADQDHVPQRETLIGNVDLVDLSTEASLSMGSLPDVKIFHTKLSERESQVLSMLLAGRSREEIMDELRITRKRFNNIKFRLKKKAV